MAVRERLSQPLPIGSVVELRHGDRRFLIVQETSGICLAKKLSQPNDADAERKLYEAFRSIFELEVALERGEAVLRRLKMKIGDTEFDAEVVEDAAHPMYDQFLSMLGHRLNPDVVESGTLRRQKVEREISTEMDSDDDSIAELFADLVTENLDRQAASDRAIQALRQAADDLQEIVTERRNSLANMALMERRIDRTQQETARILGGLIKG